MSKDDNVIQLRTGWEAILAESKVILNRLKDQPKALTMSEALDRWADSMEPCDLRDIIRGEYEPESVG